MEKEGGKATQYFSEMNSTPSAPLEENTQNQELRTVTVDETNVHNMYQHQPPIQPLHLSHNDNNEWEIVPQQTNQTPHQLDTPPLTNLLEEVGTNISTTEMLPMELSTTLQPIAQHYTQNPMTQEAITQTPQHQVRPIQTPNTIPQKSSRVENHPNLTYKKKNEENSLQKLEHYLKNQEDMESRHHLQANYEAQLTPHEQKVEEQLSLTMYAIRDIARKSKTQESKTGKMESYLGQIHKTTQNIEWNQTSYTKNQSNQQRYPTHRLNYQTTRY